VTAPAAGALLHRPLSAIVRAYGAPAAVASKDDGQHVVFSDATATLDTIIDDDAIVHALDLTEAPGTPYAFDLDGTSHTVVFGRTTSLAARDALAADAETEGSTFRVFRRDDASTVVLVFDAANALLTHVIVGDRATILRLGYLRDPAPTQQSRFPFTAPRLRGNGVPGGDGPQATVARLDLDRAGTVRDVTIIVSSADAAFDRALAVRLARESYAPALLGGRPIGASVLREIRH
jgi:hypothetical protein